MLGFPTANMLLRDDTIASLAAMENGVFYGWGVVEPEVDQPIPVVLSVGHNPHFADRDVSVEVHFVRKFEEHFYGCTVRILVLDRLREQRKYASLEALVADIKDDVRRGVELCGTDFAQRYRKSPVLRQPERSSDVPKFVSDVSATADL